MNAWTNKQQQKNITFPQLSPGQQIIKCQVSQVQFEIQYIIIMLLTLTKCSYINTKPGRQ